MTHESVFLCWQYANSDAQEEYPKQLASNERLIDFLKREIGPAHSIIGLHTALHGMYEISESTTLPVAPRNPYADARRYFPQMYVAAQETGAAFANFYEFVFLVAPERERLFHRGMDRSFKGFPNGLNDASIDFVFANIDSEPAFVQRWVASGNIQLMHRDELERWSMYRVTR
jgi:hypothetical protein